MASTKSAERIQELLEDGLRALDRSHLEGALAAWHNILDLDPKHERAARLVADLEALVGQQHRARELTGEVLVVVDEGDATAAESLQPTPGVVSRRGLARLQRLVETQSDENRQLSDTVSKRYAEILEQREQLTSAEKQVVSLRERLASFERAAAAIEVERADLGRVRGLFEHQLTLLEFRLAEQKQFEGTLRQQLVDTQAELERVRLHVESEQSEHAATRTLLEEAQRQVEHLQSQAEQVQHQMDVAAGENGDLGRELANERRIAEEATAVAHQSAMALAEMTAKLEARVQQSDAINTALSEALELAEHHAITAATLQSEVKVLGGSVVELEIARATISRLEQTTKDLSTSIAELEARALSFESEKSALIGQAQAHIDSAIAVLGAQLAEANARIVALEGDVAASRQLEEQLANMQAAHAAHSDHMVEAHDTVRQHPADMVSLRIADEAAAEPAHQSSEIDHVNEVSDSDLLAAALVTDFSDLVASPASNPAVLGPNERPTGVWDAASAFAEMATDPARRLSTVASDWMGPVFDEASVQPPGTGDFPATNSNLGFEENVEELFDMVVEESVPASDAAAAPAPAVMSGAHTFTGMAFVSQEVPSIRGTGTRPSQPPPPPEGPAHGTANKANPLSMRSSATARLGDTTLSPAEQLSWLVDEVPRLTNTGANMIRSKQIGAKEAFVVEAIDGSVSFSDIIDVVGLPSQETSAILVDLLRNGVISSPSIE